jgi:hypothetical protein
MQKAENLKHKFGKSVYEMELHEELVAEPQFDKLLGGDFECLPVRVFRVPGGWIYYNQYASKNGVFVPFDNEFEGGINNGRND